MDAHHLVSVKPNPKVPPFRPGDTVQVHYTIREGERVRTQAFQGVVIRCVGGKSPVATFTVRRVSHGIGVERIFPLYSPHVDSVNVQRHGKVRRARLYYLRDRFGRAARLKERVVRPGHEAVPAPLEVEQVIEAETVEKVSAELGAVAVEEGTAEVESEETEAGDPTDETASVAETEEEAAPLAQATAVEDSDAPVGEVPEAAPETGDTEEAALAADDGEEVAPVAEAAEPEATTEEATRGAEATSTIAFPVDEEEEKPAS